MEIDQAELARKIRQIQIRTSKAVNEVFVGQYESAFRGQGIEFEEVREYMPGDDIRSIDWNVTARTGRPHIKRFVEERELTVLLVVDLSGTMRFGTRQRLKAELTAELCAVLTFAAIRSNDRAGLLMFTDRIERFVPPRKGVTHGLRIVRDVLSYQAEGRGTDLSIALEYVARITRKRVVMFILSDFRCRGFERQLRVLAKRHDIIAMPVDDPIERALPNVGLLELRDAETGEAMLVDTAYGEGRDLYGTLEERRRAELSTRLRSAGVDPIEVSTDRPYLGDLIRFFRVREHRLGRTG